VSLVIYRRHAEGCTFVGTPNLKSCECALWLVGMLFGKKYRKSAKTRNFKAAEKIRHRLEEGEQPQEQSITIKDAFDQFISDCEGRNLHASTLGKYRLMATRLHDFARDNRLKVLSDLTIEQVDAFRKTWTASPRTLSKAIERLRAFFNFAIARDWIEKNPARALKAPEIRPNPTLPFSDSEVKKIIDKSDFRSAVFFRVLLHSGLRIIDAAQLRPEKIIDGRIFLYQQKTGVPVMCPIPPDLIHDLEKLTLVGGYYFAVESDNPKNIAEYYRRKLAKAAGKSGIKKANPHRWRDTFSVRLLERGVSLETVSILLGHTDIRVTQRHYAPWVPSRQRELEAAVAKTWTTKLVRVK
jgi:integrase/recombinase XerD